MGWLVDETEVDEVERDVGGLYKKLYLDLMLTRFHYLANLHVTWVALYGTRQLGLNCSGLSRGKRFVLNPIFAPF